MIEGAMPSEIKNLELGVFLYDEDSLLGAELMFSSELFEYFEFFIHMGFIVVKLLLKRSDPLLELLYRAR